MRTQSFLALAALALLPGCVTSTVDEVLYQGPEAELEADASVVILGRRHASDYETEPDFIDCVGKHISSRDRSIEVIGELDFLNALYPWFEPRTAPLSPQDIDKLMAADYADPLNLGRSELVSINGLLDIIEGIAGVTLERKYNLDAPQGVRGRNSDNALIHQVLGWEPEVDLATGLEKTYVWIEEQYQRRKQGELVVQ